MIAGKVPAFDDDARRDVHAQLDAFFAAQRGTLPQARVPEEIAPGKVNVLAATPTAGYVPRPQRDARALQGPNVSTAERATR